MIFGFTTFDILGIFTIFIVGISIGYKIIRMWIEEDMYETHNKNSNR